MEATLQTIQDIVTIEDFDVSDCFQYSNSMESVKSTVSETFMSKPSIAKRRANQQETEQFYFTVRDPICKVFAMAWSSGEPQSCLCCIVPIIKSHDCSYPPKCSRYSPRSRLTSLWRCFRSILKVRLEYRHRQLCLPPGLLFCRVTQQWGNVKQSWPLVYLASPWF